MSVIESLELTSNEDVKIVKLKNGKEIEVKQYLPAAEKNLILEVALDQAVTDSIINTLALDVLVKLFIVMKYTNIEINADEMTDPFGTYDVLYSNGVIDLVLNAIGEKETSIIFDNLVAMTKLYEEYMRSISSVVKIKEYLTSSLAELSDNDDNLENIKNDVVNTVVDIMKANN